MHCPASGRLAGGLPEDCPFVQRWLPAVKGAAVQSVPVTLLLTSATKTIREHHRWEDRAGQVAQHGTGSLRTARGGLVGCSVEEFVLPPPRISSDVRVVLSASPS